MNTSHLSDLRLLYRTGRLIPFIGAGVSVSVTWEEGGLKRCGPSWRQLVDSVAEKQGFLDPDLLRVRGTDLQILEYLNIKAGAVTHLLFTSMNSPNIALKNSRIHRQLALMDKCSLFYTTNYDDFIERSFALFGRPHRVIRAEKDIAEPPGDPSTCDIVKFHGDFSVLIKWYCLNLTMKSACV